MSSIESCQKLVSPEGLEIYHTGPALSEGKLPGLFYFSLSGNESLCLDPFNQPVVALKQSSVRVYSLTLPEHGPEADNKQVMKRWAKQLEKGTSFLTEFIQDVSLAVDYLISLGYLDADFLAIAGLSRGAFFATHIAAEDTRFKFVLGFAPVAKITFLEEFRFLNEDPRVSSLNLSHLVDRLAHVHLRFYIGNRDVLVSTQCCFDFISNLVESDFQKGIRSPPVELILVPSIGHKGHGTSPQTFIEGAAWIEKKLKRNS